MRTIDAFLKDLIKNMLQMLEYYFYVKLKKTKILKKF